jgi:hypothetical protein
VSESTDPVEPSRRELDELLAALRQPPRADELSGETEAVATMVWAFGSPTDDRAPGGQRGRGLQLAAVAAGLVFVVAGAAAAAPHLLKTAGTRSVVTSATSTLAVAQAGGNKPQTSSEGPARASSRIGDDVSSQPTTQAEAPTEPAMAQPEGVVASCVGRDLRASTSSTVHDSSPADSRSSPSAPTTTVPLCGQPADDGQSAVVSSGPVQAEYETHESVRPSSTPPGQVGHPGSGSDAPANTAPGQVGQPGPGSDSPANTAPGQVGQPGSDSPANTAPGRLDRLMSDEGPAVGRLHGPQQTNRLTAEEDTENDDSGPGEDNSDEEPDD